MPRQFGQRVDLLDRQRCAGKVTGIEVANQRQTVRRIETRQTPLPVCRRLCCGMQATSSEHSKPLTQGQGERIVQVRHADAGTRVQHHCRQRVRELIDRHHFDFPRRFRIGTELQAALGEQPEMVAREIAKTGAAVAGDIAGSCNERRQAEAACAFRDPLLAHPFRQQIAVIQQRARVAHLLVDAHGALQHLANRQRRDKTERLLPLSQREPQQSLGAADIRSLHRLVAMQVMDECAAVQDRVDLHRELPPARCVEPELRRGKIGRNHLDAAEVDRQPRLARLPLQYGASGIGARAALQANHLADPGA